MNEYPAFGMSVPISGACCCLILAASPSTRCLDIAAGYALGYGLEGLLCREKGFPLPPAIGWNFCLAIQSISHIIHISCITFYANH
jgi:hypothetical protein